MNRQASRPTLMHVLNVIGALVAIGSGVLAIVQALFNLFEVLIPPILLVAFALFLFALVGYRAWESPFMKKLRGATVYVAEGLRGWDAVLLLAAMVLAVVVVLWLTAVARSLQRSA